MYPSFRNAVDDDLKWNLKVDDDVGHRLSVMQRFRLFQVSRKTCQHRPTFLKHSLTSTIVLFVNFYSMTLCASAVFAVSRCLFILHLSVTLVYCIQMAEDIVKLFSQPDSPMILVFLTPAAISNSKGNPFSGGTKYTGVGKIGDSQRKSLFISEMVRDRLMVIMER